MTTIYLCYGKDTVQPNAIVYTAVIKAWIASANVAAATAAADGKKTITTTAINILRWAISRRRHRYRGRKETQRGSFIR